MTPVFIIAASLVLGALGAFIIYKCAKRLSLMDAPGERSSHSVSTSRGGGIGILFAFLLAGFFYSWGTLFWIVALGAGALGLAEDRFSLPSSLRLAIQVALAAIIGLTVAGLPYSAYVYLTFFLLIAFVTATTNFYNFMDGINGMAGLTGAVGFGLMAVAAFHVFGEPDIAVVSLAIAAASVGFLPLNFPKAKVFMGDVGSLFLGFLFAALVILLSSDAEAFLMLSMFLAPFYADAMLTLFYRFWKGENIFKAHRSHLYQYLANELKLPHWQVSTIYASIQLAFGTISMYIYMNGSLRMQAIAMAAFFVIFVASYTMIKLVKSRG